MEEKPIVTVHLEADTRELDETILKINELNELIEKANSLLGELDGHDVEIRIKAVTT